MKRLHVAAGVIRGANGHVLIAKRPMDKHQGGLWEFPGGKVEEGESAESALARELAEELGVAGVPLTEHFRFFFNSAESQLWGGVFSCRWDGPLTLQPEEVQAVRWVDPRSDWQRAGEQYAPDSLEALARLLQHSSLELHA